MVKKVIPYSEVMSIVINSNEIVKFRIFKNFTTPTKFLIANY